MFADLLMLDEMLLVGVIRYVLEAQPCKIKSYILHILPLVHVKDRQDLQTLKP